MKTEIIVWDGLQPIDEYDFLITMSPGDIIRMADGTIAEYDFFITMSPGDIIRMADGRGYMVDYCILFVAESKIQIRVKKNINKI